MRNFQWQWFPLAITIVLLSATSIGACAETLHYWRFEGTNFLSDSVGSADLDSTSAIQTAYGDMGPGSNFPSQAGASGASKSTSSTEKLVVTPGDLPTGDFTIELLGNFNGLLGSLGTVLAASGQSTSNVTIGWALQARNVGGIANELVMLVVDGSDIEFVQSGVALSTGVDYYIGASFSTAGTLDFFVQNFTAGTGLQQITRNHSKSQYNDGVVFGIGSINGSLPASGLYDEVRLSDAALQQEELLLSAVPIPGAFALLLMPLAALGLQTSRKRANCTI